MEEAEIWVVTTDASVRRKLERAGAPCAFADSVAALPGAGRASAVVVDLDLAGAADAAPRLRAAFGDALLAAFVSVPDPARWEAAVAGGYDLVATRGTIAAQTIERLRTWTGPSRRRRIRLAEAADLTGRLGCVLRLEASDAGPVALYQIGRELFAVEDACPHAGATLSTGTMSGSVVTCPLHGSQFDVRNGERVRGPADRAISTFDVVVDGGVVYLEID